MRKVVVFLIFFVFIFNSSFEVLAAVVNPEDLVPDSIEYQALVDLYSSTDGGNWANNTNWLNGNSIDSIANWHGIKVTNGDVTEITLNNNITTIFHPEIIFQFNCEIVQPLST